MTDDIDYNDPSACALEKDLIDAIKATLRKHGYFYDFAANLSDNKGGASARGSKGRMCADFSLELLP